MAHGPLAVDMNIIIFRENNDTKIKKQNGVNGCVQCSQSDFFMIFQASSLGFSWNHIKCKNIDQTCLFQCTYICRVPRKKSVHLA